MLKPIVRLREAYQKSPQLYTLCELCAVLGGVFLIVWVLQFCYWKVYLCALASFLCLLVFVSSFLVHEDTLKELGIRVDNLSRSSKETSIVTFFGVALIVSIFLFYRDTYKPHDPGRLLAGFAGYFFWGTVQQFILNSFLYLRLRKLVENNLAAIICAAVIFSLIHAPNTGLMLFSGFGGLLCCYLFSRNRNIFPLGVMQGTLAMLTLWLLVPGLVKDYALGPPGAQRYDAYGNAVLLASGDINGDGRDEILVSKGPAEQNDTEVLVLTGDGVLLHRFRAFDTGSYYGANLCAGDVDGDGKDEIIAARGPWHNNDTLIKVFTGSGSEVTSFYAFPGKRYGANVAAGDINGDGKDEIIVGMGPGQGYRPVIRIFTGKGVPLLEFQVDDFIDDIEYYKTVRHGIGVSSGDIDGDGRDEIVAGTAHVSPYQTYWIAIDFDRDTTIPIQSQWLRVFIPGALYGVSTALGDVDGDGLDEIVAGPGPYTYSGAHLRVLKSNGSALFETFPFDAHHGLTVATADLDGDGTSEILTSPGIGEEKAGPVIRVLDISGVKRELDLRPYIR